ncbi:MAG: TonB-dependent receptor [Elusimicrobia bacterium]|nr:TonB-dependent receptor [Elusimicrobiota bacterium]MBU2615108.1 TonB-dependent receptor [Elusimicrobiota bacterium]
MRFVAVIWCLLLFNSILFAAHPLATDDAGTVDVAKHEMEVGYDNSKVGNDLRNISSGLSLKQGLTERMDIGVSFPYQMDPTQDERFGEAVLGVKFALVKDVFALTFSNELGEKEYLINGIYTKEFSKAVVHFNLGYSATGDPTIKGAAVYSSAFEIPVNKFDLIGEVAGDTNDNNTWLLGARYRITENIVVDAGYGRSFNTSDDKTILGFHCEF